MALLMTINMLVGCEVQECWCETSVFLWKKKSGGKESTKYLSTSETLDAKTETYGARRQKEFTAMRRKGQSDGVISVIFCINILFNRADPQ